MKSMFIEIALPRARVAFALGATPEYLDHNGIERIIPKMNCSHISFWPLLRDANKAPLENKEDVIEFADFLERRLSAGVGS